MLLWRIQSQNIYMAFIQCEIVLLYPETDIRMKSTQVLKEMEAGHDRSLRLLQV